MILRLIGKWLTAGVLEGGATQLPRARDAAGRGDLTDADQHLPARSAGHLVRANDVKPRLSGPAFLVRFADDAVLVFA